MKNNKTEKDLIKLLSNCSAEILSDNIKDILNTDGVDYTRELLYKLVSKLDSNMLFKAIYNIKELEFFVMYLLHKNLINFNFLHTVHYNYLINETAWGLDFCCKNIDVLFSQHSFFLFDFDIDEVIFKKMLYSFKDSKNKIKFLQFCINHFKSLTIDEKEIIGSLYKDPFDLYFEQLTFEKNNSNNPFIFNNLAYIFCSNEKYKYLLDKYPYELFYSQLNKKLYLLNTVDSMRYLRFNYVAALILYDNCSIYDRNELDTALSNLITYGDYNKFSEDFFQKFGNASKLKMIGAGETSVVFSDENNILKLGSTRFNTYKNPDFYRVIPSIIESVKDTEDNICCVIEWQKKINNSDKEITLPMIYELFEDFKKHGYYISDPRCLRFCQDNFGFLDSYKDASKGSYDSVEDFPESFKNCPLVLLDVDLIYRYDEPEVSLPFVVTPTMDEVINDYKFLIKK